MHERGRLKSVPLAFFSQIVGRQAAQFPIDQWCQVFERLLVAPGPFRQEERYFVGFRQIQIPGNIELVPCPALYTSNIAKLGDSPDISPSQESTRMITFSHIFRMCR